jgi:dCTP deaminase
MLLNDENIRKLCVFDEEIGGQRRFLVPFADAFQGREVISYGLSHAGYDFRLGNELWVFKNSYGTMINPKLFKHEGYRKKLFDIVYPGAFIPIDADLNMEHVANAYIIPAHSYALGVTLEHIDVPTNLKGRCVGKSTLARCGILINTTPLEPGWRGYLTLEISNITPCPAVIFAGEGIAQLEVEHLIAPPKVDYDAKDGKYQDQGAAPVPARTKQ